ncbi:MAG: enoyl-CoA hydratase/isomerase family protein [Cyclobacteriaceae bacterium]
MRDSATKVLLSHQQGVGVISLNHPPANAYDIDLMTQLEQQVIAANENNDIRAVLLNSALPKFFCAGADIRVFGENDIATNQVLVAKARQVAERINSSNKIYIAVLTGHTLGGGLELAMACDLRLAAEGDYLLGLPEVKLGLIPGNGGTQRFLRLIGAAKALELMVTGESIHPSEAFRLGLVNRLYSADMIAEESMKYAQALASGPSLAIAAIKRSVCLGEGMTLSVGLKLEESLVNPLYNSEDAAEGYAAYVEKRLPRFKGK